MKKFAFLLLGSHYTPEDRVTFHSHGITSIITVNSFEEATEQVIALWKDGYGAIELCGAFGKERAEELISVTNNEVAIGYVVHNSEQNKLFDNFFTSK